VGPGLLKKLCPFVSVEGDFLPILAPNILISCVFQFAIQKFKDQVTQNYNFASCLYRCETWSLTLREERRLRVFENRVLRIVFGRKRYEVTGKCRKLHNEELSDLYSLPNVVRVVKSRRSELSAGGLVTEELTKFHPYPTTRPQHNRCHKTKPALHSLMLLKMGKIIARNMSS
jgi:hypothetical protein